MATPATKEKTTLKILLIIAMVIQPVLVSYAMADMLGSHHQAAAVTGQAAEGSITNSDASAQAQHSDLSQNNSPNIGGDANASDECCNSAHCCPAAVVDVDVMPHGQSPVFFTPFLLSWQGINLSAEIRPPRSLLG